MFGIEKSYCNAMLTALLDANQSLLETSLDEAVEASYVKYKGDTLGLDQVPENAVARALTEFDQYAVLLTEECGEEANPLARRSAVAIRGPRTFFVCDPCDGSAQLSAFLRVQGNGRSRVADVLKSEASLTAWEEKFAAPVLVTGANAAITCVRRGLPIAAVMLNYVTQTITVACSAGMYTAAVPDGDVRVGLDDLKEATRLLFPNTHRSRSRWFAAFMGKPERGYPQNFAMTKLAAGNEARSYLHYDRPGGPSRILYLSDRQPADHAVGFIVANGEKISEWIHWLPFIRYAKREDDRGANALRIFEITQEGSNLRDGYLMMPTEPYSIFSNVENDGTVINVDRLGNFANPSKYRATLLVTPATNKWAISRAYQCGYRELVFYSD